MVGNVENGTELQSRFDIQVQECKRKLIFATRRENSVGSLSIWMVDAHPSAYDRNLAIVM
jgi:hypothetical protein